MIKSNVWAVALFALVVGCDEQRVVKPVKREQAAPQTLVEARRAVKPPTDPQTGPREPVATPPANLFRVVKYPSPVGELPAYLSVTPTDGQRRPAIVWITGGDCNTIGDVWSPAPAENDQNATALREAGIVIMFPTLRGGNDAPGRREGYLGEVDDVLAAADFLAKQPGVDPQRIYLGGHSTGGTLALLVAECSPRFKAVFSFGPVGDVSGYGPEYLPFDATDAKAVSVRSPMYWLPDITSPTFVIEGVNQGNVDSLRAMKQVNENPAVRFFEVPGANHFSVLRPVQNLLAKKILAGSVEVTEEEVRAAMRGR
ncbi:MAG: alpha/beta hydrolase family protein [Phycisphaerae bacterium]|nr:prolyl oligopeptidase family serine peptidase [Tepidisphaeraceae bacterium]